MECPLLLHVALFNFWNKVQEGYCDQHLTVTVCVSDIFEDFVEILTRTFHTKGTDSRFAVTLFWPEK